MNLMIDDQLRTDSASFVANSVRFEPGGGNLVEQDPEARQVRIETKI